jgi:hypothetical protein
MVFVHTDTGFNYVSVAKLVHLSMLYRWRLVWEWSYSPNRFLPEHCMEIIGQFHFLAVLAQGTEPAVTNVYECVWTPAMARALWRRDTLYRRVSEICEERLLASSCPSVWSPAWNNWSDFFNEIYYLSIFRKNIQKNSSLIKIWQK